MMRPFTATLLATACATALAGCKMENKPLLAWNQPTAADYAMPGPPDLAADTLPGAMQLAPTDLYLYPARAARVSRSYYDEAPSYGFDYGGAQPWVWAADDSDWMVSEPYDDGYRTYYYEPGETYPYFVQDAGYGYAYGDNGSLVALFDAAGMLLSRDRYDSYAPRARDYWSRGYALDQAYRTSPRYRIEDTVWRERAPQFVQARQQWFDAAARQPTWREVADRSDYTLPHDNGRHRGWDKARGPAPAAIWSPDRDAPQRIGREEARRAEAVAAPPGHDWSKQEARAQKEDRRLFRQETRQQAKWEARKADDQGGGHGRGHGGGWKATAPAAPEHAQNVAERQGGWKHGQDRGDHGGGPKGGDHGGDKGHGNDHGGGGDHGGGKGHGGGKH